MTSWLGWPERNVGKTKRWPDPNFSVLKSVSDVCHCSVICPCSAVLTHCCAGKRQWTGPPAFKAHKEKQPVLYWVGKVKEWTDFGL